MSNLVQVTICFQSQKCKMFAIWSSVRIVRMQFDVSAPQQIHSNKPCTILRTYCLQAPEEECHPQAIFNCISSGWQVAAFKMSRNQAHLNI